jgi:hypothetical protein
MRADILCMPIYERHFEPGQLQFITTSTYRRSRLFTCRRFCRIFVEQGSAEVFGSESNSSAALSHCSTINEPTS